MSGALSADQIGQHSVNAVFEPTPERPDRWRVKCNRDDFYDEADNYWVAIRAHEGHVAGLIAEALAAARADERARYPTSTTSDVGGGLSAAEEEDVSDGR